MKSFYSFLSPPSLGIIVYLIVRLITDSALEDELWERPISITVMELAAIILVSYIFRYVIYQFKINTKKNVYMSMKSLWRSIFIEFGLFILISILILNLTLSPFAAFTDDGLSLHDLVIINTVPLLFLMLVFAINSWTQYLNSYIDTKIRLERITRIQLDNELKYLKAQFHPHFLFNALNSIYFQMDQSVTDAKKTVEKFSDLLRYQLYHKEELVEIERELEYINNYIDLQLTRQSEHLIISKNIASVDGKKIYPFLLFPLMENALKHVDGAMRVQINAKIERNVFKFEVLNSISSKTRNSVDVGGVGLKNLKKRLKLLYPNSHEISISFVNEQCIASLSIPYNES